MKDLQLGVFFNYTKINYLYVFTSLLLSCIVKLINLQGAKNEMVKREDLIKGAEYKVKYEGEKRAATRTYEGLHQTYDYDEQGEIIEGEVVAQFSGRGGWKFYSFDKIVSAELVDPTKQKPKKLRTCNRCYGAGKFEHVAHVANGVCFKCHGTGTI